jgi:hypothetical protein
MKAAGNPRQLSLMENCLRIPGRTAVAKSSELITRRAALGKLAGLRICTQSMISRIGQNAELVKTDFEIFFELSFATRHRVALRA